MLPYQVRVMTTALPGSKQAKKFPDADVAYGEIDRLK
ncbi:hypothetical protein PMI06_008801 [Burkholderia sp. BT03]|nr:hypothetical protein PMI06_008801 [Burkholderia sp. BT03]SKC52936.1 hypothetical protein SAMN06266956_0545 [Paraburkholderia hospita]